MREIGQDEVDRLHERLDREAEASGYHLNPDAEFTRDVVRGLIVNQDRYGYWACPCRLADGAREKDLDIICPCDYRDADVDEFDACYCALYVSGRVLRGEAEIRSIPERRPSDEERRKAGAAPRLDRVLAAPLLPVWRCKVCGYLCAREAPPEVCPICKARRDRFETFIEAKGRSNG